MIPKVILDFFKILSSSAIPVPISEDLLSFILDNYNNDMTLPLQLYKDFFRFIDSEEFKRRYLASVPELDSLHKEMRIWVLLTRCDVLVDAHIELIDSLSWAQKLYMLMAVTTLESVQQLTTKNFNQLIHDLNNLEHKVDILNLLQMYNIVDPEFLQLADIPGFHLKYLRNILQLFHADLRIDIPKIKGNLTYTKWIETSSNKRKGIFNIISKIEDRLTLEIFNILLDNYTPIEDLDLQYFIAILMKDNILTAQDLKQLLCAAPILAKAKIDITNVALDRVTLKKILFFIDTFSEDDAISAIKEVINYVPAEFFQQEALPVEPTQPALPEEAAVVVDDSPSVLENLHEKWNSLTGWYNSHFVSMDTNVDSQNLSAIKMQLMAMDAWSEDYLPYLTKTPVPSIFMKSLIILNQEISESCMVKIYLDYLFILTKEDECINFIKTIAFLDKYDWFAATSKILLQNINPLLSKIENLENLFGIIKEMESFDALNQTTYTELMQNNYTITNGRLFSPLKPKTSSLTEIIDAAHSKFNSDGLGIDLDKKADLSDNFRLFVNVKSSHQYVGNDMHDEKDHPISFAPHDNL